MNTTTINRSTHDPTHPYLKVSNQLLRDKRLNVSAIGLMCAILSNSDTYIINSTYIKRMSGLTRTQFYKAWDQLKSCQYIIEKQTGKGSWDYIINKYTNPDMPLVVCHRVHSKDNKLNNT